MKHYLLLLTFLVVSFQTFAQTAQDLIQLGIEAHDNGNYDEALNLYKKALKEEPKSSLIYAEMAMTLNAQEKYKSAVKYAKKSIALSDGDNIIGAYVTLGSALDMLGKVDDSIEVFNKAIKETKGHYLLFYNLGLNYFKIGDYDNAIINMYGSLGLNFSHASSHLLLAKAQEAKGKKVQALLGAYYFLFLEPTSNRTIEGNQLIKRNLVGEATKDPNKPNNFNINLALPDSDDEFAAAALSLSMIAVTNQMDENKDKSEEVLFQENTTSFFKILGELKAKNDKSGLYWGDYITFFFSLSESNHMETFCKYITIKENDQSLKWLQENEEKLNAFSKWLEGPNENVE